MKTFTRSLLLLAVVLVASVASSSVAEAGGCGYGGYRGYNVHHTTYRAPVYNQQYVYVVPSFGFRSIYDCHAGQRVTSIIHGGIACQMGLLPGDVILSANGYLMNYDCAWGDTLRHCIEYNGGLLELQVRRPCGDIVCLRWQFPDCRPIR